MMNSREKEILMKAADILYSLSCRTDSKLKEKDYENLAAVLEEVVEEEYEE